MGRTTIYNMMVKVEGDFELRSPNYFVGNFNSGSRDYLDTTITANTPGTANGKIIYQFEDAAGEKQEVVQEFSVEVMERSNDETMPGQGGKPQNPGDYPGGQPDVIPGETQTPIWQNPIFWGVLIALIIAIFVIRKIRKNKKNKQIEQDLLKDIEIDE